LKNLAKRNRNTTISVVRYAEIQRNLIKQEVLSSQRIIALITDVITAELKQLLLNFLNSIIHSYTRNMFLRDIKQVVQEEDLIPLIQKLNVKNQYSNEFPTTS